MDLVLKISNRKRMIEVICQGITVYNRLGIEVAYWLRGQTDIRTGIAKLWVDPLAKPVLC